MRSRCKLLLVLFVLGSLNVVGQEVRKSMTLQDLVGEWELVSHQINIPRFEKYSAGLIRISVKGDEVTLFRRLEDSKGFVERTFTYYADERGEINSWIGEDGNTVHERKTKTIWKKGALRSKWSYKTTFGWFDVESSYRLSKDLVKLEYEHSQKGAGPVRSEFSERIIFRRV